jgi:hypothetical protein
MRIRDDGRYDTGLTLPVPYLLPNNLVNAVISVSRSWFF